MDLGCGAGVPCTKLLAKRHSGFDLLVDEVVTTQEPEGPATFQWILGEKRSAKSAAIFRPAASTYNGRIMRRQEAVVDVARPARVR